MLPELERRRLQRIPMRGRVTGRAHGAAEISGISKDVSADGMFIFVDAELVRGARVELVLELPSQEVFRDTVTLRCVGRVVRTEVAPLSGMHGVAVVFEDAEIMPSGSAAPA